MDYLAAQAKRGRPKRSVNARQQLTRPEPSTVPAALKRWVKAWLDDRRARGLTSVRENDAHWRCHIAPVIGHRHVGHWTAADMRELCASLDAKVREGSITWKTAMNVWGTATRICADACASKLDTLRCREDNPARDVRGPDRGSSKARAFLYPSEVERFLASELVPLEWRRLVALAVYTYLRAGELSVLRWDDVNVEHGVITVHRAADRTKADGAEKSTKGRKPRRIPIEASLAPMLEQMHKTAGGKGLVLPNIPSDGNMARALRLWLERIGVDRAELHDASPTRKPLTFHDLRGTGITWMAVRGDHPLKIQERAGHARFSTTEGYIRTAETLQDGFGEPFPALPRGVLNGDAGHASVAPKALRIRPRTRRNRPQQSSTRTISRENSNDSTQLWRRGRDSNPR